MSAKGTTWKFTLGNTDILTLSNSDDICEFSPMNQTCKTEIQNFKLATNLIYVYQQYTCTHTHRGSGSRENWSAGGN